MTTGCGLVLHVRGGFGNVRLRLHEGLLDAEHVSPSAKNGALEGLARIDGRRGSEVLVTLDRGAASSGVAVYTYRRGRLRVIPLAHRRYGSALFWEASGLRYSAAADCRPRASSGYVETSYEELQDDSRWMVDRVVYRETGGRFTEVRRRHYVSSRSLTVFRRHPLLFPSCR